MYRCFGRSWLSVEVGRPVGETVLPLPELPLEVGLLHVGPPVILQLVLPVDHLLDAPDLSVGRWQRVAVVDSMASQAFFYGHRIVVEVVVESAGRVSLEFASGHRLQKHKLRGSENLIRIDVTLLNDRHNYRCEQRLESYVLSMSRVNECFGQKTV